MNSLSKIHRHITPLAQEMIKAKGLATVLDRVFQEIQSLPLGEFQVKKVDVEWEVDPEVEGWETLFVTLWCYGSVEDAQECWGELDKAMARLRQTLSQAELDKLNKLISVGVDIE